MVAKFISGMDLYFTCMDRSNCIAWWADRQNSFRYSTCKKQVKHISYNVLTLSTVEIAHGL